MTAVQWLEKQYLLTNGELVCQDFEYAEKLEKQQIIDAYYMVSQDAPIKGGQSEISDEEIMKGAKEWYNKEGAYSASAIALKTWVFAIKWYREQIKKTSI